MKRIINILSGKSLALVVIFLFYIISPTAQSAEKPKNIRLYVMDCGVILYNNLQKFGYKPGEIHPTNLSDGCYLIVHPTKGTLLWDTGVIADSLWGKDGVPPKKFYAEGTIPLNQQLAQIGYKPDDITYVSVSHSHWDHISNLYQFAGDTWLTSRYTHDKLLSQDPPEKTDPSMFTALKNTKTIILPDNGNYDVFGDGSVTIIPSPGHTPDSRVLMVKLHNTGPVILSGDLYHFVADLKSNNTQNNEDRPTSLASRQKIQTLLKQVHGQLWINHDYNTFQKLKKEPDYYD